MLNINLPACTKVELWDLTVCIAVNGEKFRSRQSRQFIEDIELKCCFSCQHKYL